MRKFIIFRHMPDQLDDTFSRTAAAIPLILQDPPCLRAPKIPLQKIRPVQIQQYFFIRLSENDNPNPLFSEKPVQSPHFITDILSRFYADREHVSGLQSRQGGRALVDQQLLRHYAMCSFKISLSEFIFP